MASSYELHSSHITTLRLLCCAAATAAGYCGARGKFDDPEVAKAVGETISTLTDFLNKQLK